MEALRSWWEVPSVAHFCSLFREAFDLPDFDIEELEEGLLASSDNLGDNNNNNFLIEQLTLRLLQGYHQRPDVINVNNQDKYLFDLVNKKWTTEGRSVDALQAMKFVSLPLRTKVEILFSLCDYRLDAADVMDVLKNLDSESLRVEPLGRDDTGSTYWYFYGTRLYKEQPSAKTKTKQHVRRHRIKDKCKKETRGKRRHKKSSVRRGEDVNRHACSSDVSENENDVNPDWSVVCSIESDWIELSEKFRFSVSRVEQELHTCLAEDFLPEIGRIIQDKERNNRKRLLEAMPRRASHRIELLRQEVEEQAEIKVVSVTGNDRDSVQRLEAQRRQRGEEEVERMQRREDRALERLAAAEERASRASKRLARTFTDYAASEYESSTPCSNYSTSSSSSDDDSAQTKKLRSATKYVDIGDEQRRSSSKPSGGWWTEEPCLILNPRTRFARDSSESLLGRPTPTKILQICPNQVISMAPPTCHVGSFCRGTIALHRPP